METVDVVYVLGTGSNWNNNEIRFSLRAIEKNLKGVGNIFIIGEKPDWLQNVIHIPHPDEYGAKNADGNIIRKVLRAIEDERLSNRFLFINDDHLVVQPIEAGEVPYFHKGDMNTYKAEYFKVNYWRKRLGRTKDVLNFKGLPAFHFDCHTPIVFDKNLFPEIVGRFDYGVGPGYTMKSIYSNTAGVEPTMLTDQKKVIFDHYTRAQIDKRVEGCTFISYNDAGLNNELKMWLAETFSKQSRFEKTGYSDMFWDIAKALQTPNDKELIRSLFIKYGRERNLVAMVESTYTDQLHEKILFKLRRMLP
jgi:hypothetical protein